MLSGIAAKTKVFELGENGGNNDDWFKLITALAVSGAPHAEDYFVEFASKVENADSEEELRWKFKTCQKDANANKAQADGLEIITVGTLLKYAYEAGADLSPWRSQAESQPAQLLPLPFINMSSWDNEPLPEREWAVSNKIPLRQTALISGEGGVGKSYVRCIFASRMYWAVIGSTRILFKGPRSLWMPKTMKKNSTFVSAQS